MHLFAVPPSARRLVALPVVVLALAAFAAPARATWSQPVGVSAGHDAIDNLTLASGPGGDLLSWRVVDLLPPAREIFGKPGARYATAAVGEPFAAERVLPPAYTTGPLVDLHGGLVAQLIMSRRGPAGAGAVPEVALGTTAGAFSAPQRIPSTAWRASLSGDLRGDLLLAWLHPSRSVEQVWASLRPAGGRFGRPTLLAANGDAQLVTAQVGPPSHSTRRGAIPSDMAIAYVTRRGRLIVRVRRRGRGWGRAQDVGPAARGTGNEVALHITRDGRVIVAWHHQQLSEGGPLGPGYTQAAIEPSGSGRFGRAQTLERDPLATLPGEPAIATQSGRGVVVAFVAQPGRAVAGMFPPPVVEASFGRADRLGPARRISPVGQSVSDLAAAEGSQGVLLTWSATPSPPSPLPFSGPAIYAAATARSGAGRFQAAEQVSPSEQAYLAVPTDSESGERWLVAWVGRPLYSSPAQPGPDVVQISSCPLPCD